jgi:DNA (cytosine-5)-methyltransferase 1
MRFATVCSGVEAVSLAWEPLGFTPVFFSENAKAPSKVLKHHWPHVPNLGDMTQIDGRAWRGQVDVLWGSTPCQSFSLAGRRAGLADPRGGLTLKFVDLADEIDPAFVCWENVKGVLSDKHNAFGCLLAGLAGEDVPLVPSGTKWSNAGYVLGPQRAVAWRLFDAEYAGLAQRRERVFLVSCPRDGADPREVLFERDGLRRDHPPSRETGTVVAALTARGVGVGGPDLAHAQAGHLLPVVAVRGEITHPLRGESHDGGEDGLGKGTPIVAFSCKDDGGDAAGDVAPTLRAMTHEGSHANAGGQLAVAYAVASRGRDDGATLELGGEVANSLRAADGGGSRELVLIAEAPLFQKVPVTPQTLVTAARLVRARVRRLTPLECERLMGFPDNHTLVPGMADAPRYKMCGNSVAVPDVRFIGQGIKKVGLCKT